MIVSKRLLAAVIGGFFLGALSGLVGLGHWPQPPGPVAHPAPSLTGVAQIGGPFKLVNHLGQATTDADLENRGHILVLFGYTRSVNLTPAAMQVVSQWLHSVGENSKKIVPVFITLDPEFDTPEVLQRFLADYHPAFIGLTGSVQNIADAAKAYKIFFSRPANSDNNIRIAYDPLLFVMDRSGRYIAHLRFPASPAKLDSLLRPRL